jgi:2-oxoglutarate dehydrogenase E2 component (dihydrolipoamide succinyltransferase)
MVPVVRNAELNRGVEADIKRLAIRARDGQITVDDMTGGTLRSLTVVYLVLCCLHHYQSSTGNPWNAHNIIERPIAVNGKVEIHPMMYVAFVL